MKSLDTNILIYAANKNCAEHAEALTIVREVFAAPAEWIIADQVMFEYLRALSNKAIFSKPLSKEQAVKCVRNFREGCGARFCAYESAIFNTILEVHTKGPRDRLYDLVLAETLKHFGVEQFYTRNTKDFRGLGFAEVIDPISSS